MNEDRRNDLLSNDELTIREAGELWGVPPATVLNYIRANLVEARNVAAPGLRKAKWRINTASLKRRLGIEDQVPA